MTICTIQQFLKLPTVEFFCHVFRDFPIHKAENARVGANFDKSYLSNRKELRIKWAHFEKQITRAIIYVSTNKISFLFFDVRPPCPLD